MRRATNCLVVIGCCLMAGLPRAASGQSSAPVLFVHGMCSSSHTWDPLLDTLRAERPVNYGNRIVRLYYDGASVQRADVGLLGPAIDPGLGQVRLFTIDFFNPYAGRTEGFNADRVMDLGIEYKAREIRAVAAKIRSLTGASKVILVGHSMGGLASRAYVQNQGSDPYANDVGMVVSVDSPHRGSEWAHANLPIGLCGVDRSTVKTQLRVDSDFIQQLNSAPLPASVAFVSIASWTRFSNSTTPDSLREAGDGIVTLSSQTLKADAYALNSNVTSVENIISADSCAAIGIQLPFSRACQLHTKVLDFRKTADLVNGLLDEMVPCRTGGSTTLTNGDVPVRAIGSVITRASDGTVWVLRAGDEHNMGLHRDGVPSADRLANLYVNGSKWFGDVVSVSEEEFVQYAPGGTLAAIGPLSVAGAVTSSARDRQPGTLIKYGSEISVVSEGGRRHAFTSGDNYVRMGYSFCQPREVSVGEYYSYAPGAYADSRSMFFQ